MAKRGRRPLEPGEASTVLAVRLPESEFDRLDEAARNDRQTLAEYVRQRLAPAICKHNSDNSVH
jgi:predicted DNA-binding protein